MSSAQSLAARLLKGTRQTADMKRGADMESEGASEYCQHKSVNYTPCGLVIHPDAPWLGASTDDVQHIHVDHNITSVIREKVDQFYFHVFMPYYFSVSKRVIE